MLSTRLAFVTSKSRTSESVLGRSAPHLCSFRKGKGEEGGAGSSVGLHNSRTGTDEEVKAPGSSAQGHTARF